MFVVRKLTPTYDQNEDRIALNAEAVGGDVMRLWCTQRLLNRVVRALTGMIDKERKAEVAFGNDDRQLHAFEQSVAQARLRPDTAVKVDPVNTAAKLLTSVDITPRDGRYTIIFKHDVAEVALLGLTATELRQWLGILHKLYKTAEWPVGHWPAWFSEAAAMPAGSGQTVQLH